MEVTPPPLPSWRRNKNTRYYRFTRVNPKSVDYTLLISRCRSINAYLSYVVTYDGNRVQVNGFIIPPHRTVIGNIQRMFPNFLFSHIDDFSILEREMEGVGATFINEHRFKSIKRVLFSDEVSAEVLLA